MAPAFSAGKRVWRALLLFSVLCFLTVNGWTATLDLDTNWKVSYKNQVISHRFNLLWKNTHLANEEQIEIVYTSDFEFPQEGGSILHHLIIPSSWMPYQVILNGTLVADNGYSTNSINRIYASRLVPLPNSLFRTQNKLMITAKGAPLLGGFRSDQIIITDNQSKIHQEQLKNFYLNDVHLLFFMISLALGIFCFIIHYKLRDVSFKYLYLGIASITILPYHLLTTTFYSNFNLPITAPFRIQLFFQVLSWTFWGIFFLSNQQSERSQNYFRNLFFNLLFVPYLIFVGWAGVSLSYQWYSTIIVPCFLVPLFLGTYWLVSLAQRERKLFFLAIAGVLTAHISFLSELLNLNLYLIGLSTTLFGIIGSLLFLTEYFGTSERNKSSTNFLSQLLPTPIKDEVNELINKGAGKDEVVQKLRGDGTLINIFVDICSFGRLTRELSSKTVYETRLTVFNFISDILVQHDIHFIKPVGDSMHFCGGILLHSRPSQTRISTACIYGVRDILDGIDSLNAVLKEKNLPEVKLKVSATIGHCEFGFEGTSNNLRFDVQGHWVNITKRLEDHMDKNFYEKYGQNVALISENLFKFSENVSLRKRFFATERVTDKDGKVYEALVGQQYQEAVTDQDVMNAIFGQFSHQRRDRGSNAA
jgi:class 3 adenylate cyclase